MDVATSPHILIVDDDPNDCVLAEYDIRRGLGRCQLTSVTTRAALDRAFESGRFDAIVTDYNLGWSDGIRVFGTVRQRWPEVPVIMFTGAECAELETEAMEAGLNGYVAKSDQLGGQLAAAVRAALETPQSGLATPRKLPSG